MRSQRRPTCWTASCAGSRLRAARQATRHRTSVLCRHGRLLCQRVPFSWILHLATSTRPRWSIACPRKRPRVHLPACSLDGAARSRRYCLLLLTGRPVAMGVKARPKTFTLRSYYTHSRHARCRDGCVKQATLHAPSTHGLGVVMCMIRTLILSDAWPANPR